VIIESFAEASKSSRKFPINAGLPQNVENEQYKISIAILALLIENTLIDSDIMLFYESRSLQPWLARASECTRANILIHQLHKE
jgi:hypothetical protein